MSGKWIAMFLGLYVVILLISATAGGGSVVVGADSEPMTQLSYLIRMNNAVQTLPIFGGIPFPFPNPQYFVVLWQTITLDPLQQMLVNEGYQIFYFIVVLPIVVMGIYALVSLFIGLVRGNLSWG